MVAKVSTPLTARSEVSDRGTGIVGTGRHSSLLKVAPFNEFLLSISDRLNFLKAPSRKAIIKKRRPVLGQNVTESVKKFEPFFLKNFPPDQSF